VILGVGVALEYITIFSNLIIQGATPVSWGFNLATGAFYFPFIIYILVLAIFIVYNFFHLYRKADIYKKTQLLYLFLGFSIFIGANIIFNVAVRQITGSDIYYRFGNYSSIFLIGLTAYAIVKKRLFGIRVILTELLVGIIAVLLLIQIFISGSPTKTLVWAIVFLLFTYLGISLIKSVLREIKRREELERLTEQLKKANIALRKLDEAKSEFISIASHQLRTPLTAIKGYISMMLEGSYGDILPKMRKPLESVYQSNERLIKLVRDLLNLSRIEAGKIKLEQEKISLETLIEEIIKEVKMEAERKGLYIKFERPPSTLPQILLDKEKITQVLLNILDNALKYTQKGGITIKLQSLTHSGQREKLKIIISDTGEGMTKEEISHLFKSFSRGVAGTKLWTEGAGLGLYIAKKFIDLHKGKIWAESKGKGKGSIFYIELPISHKSKKENSIPILKDKK
jgi:signal transduction histidine kinase